MPTPIHSTLKSLHLSNPNPRLPAAGLRGGTLRYLQEENIEISKKHLDRYIGEFEFRFNNRNNPYIFRDVIRELATCGNLEYRELVKA